MSLTSRIQDQKDHITQGKRRMIKYPQKRNTRIGTIKNPYLLSQANRDKNLTHKIRVRDYVFF